MSCCRKRHSSADAAENGGLKPSEATSAPARRGSQWSGKDIRLVVMLGMTFGYFLVEIVVGYMTNSMSLVADSFHMLSDVLALCIAMACMKISKKRSQKNTFGWVRAEILGALVNAVFLMALCFSIFVEAIKRLLEPEMIEDPLKILIVGTIGLIVNIVGILMFHSHASLGGHGHSHGGGGGHSHGGARTSNSRHDEDRNGVTRHEGDDLHKLADAHNVALVLSSLNEESGEEVEDLAPLTADERQKKADIQVIDDGHSSSPNADKKKKNVASSAQLNMHGVFLHILGDAFGSVIVILNALVCWRTDNDTLKKYLDPSLSLIMVLIIMTTTTPLLKESALILLQTAPKFMNVSEIKERLLQFEGVLAVHEFHVWRLAGEKIIATVHIRFRSLQQYLAAVDKIKSFFHDHDIHSTTIQPEFQEMGGSAEEESAGYGGSRECFVRCPTEDCDVAATCCGPTTSPPNAGGAAVPPPVTSSREEKRLVQERRSFPDNIDRAVVDGGGSGEGGERSTALLLPASLQSSQSASVLMCADTAAHTAKEQESEEHTAKEQEEEADDSTGEDADVEEGDRQPLVASSPLSEDVTPPSARLQSTRDSEL